MHLFDMVNCFRKKPAKCEDEWGYWSYFTGANIDCIDGSGKTPLLLALEEGRFEIAEYLMKRGCNVNAVDGLGQSALHFVANGTHSHCIKMVDKIMKNGKYNPGQQNSYKKDLYDWSATK